MQEFLSTFQWGPVHLALIPLALAVAVLVYERFQDEGDSSAEPPRSTTL